MKHSNPIQELIDAWPNRAAFAEEIGEDVQTVHKWAQRGRVPAARLLAVADAAMRRGLTYVTYEWMVRTHADTSNGSARGLQAFDLPRDHHITGEAGGKPVHSDSPPSPTPQLTVSAGGL